MKRVRWHGLTATYTTTELELMAQLRQAGDTRSLHVIHEIKALLDARIIASEQRTYTYRWGNNPRRAELKGRRCVIEATGSKNTALIQFLDTGERVTTSRRALEEIA